MWEDVLAAAVDQYAVEQETQRRDGQYELQTEVERETEATKTTRKGQQQRQTEEQPTALERWTRYAESVERSVQRRRWEQQERARKHQIEPHAQSREAVVEALQTTVDARPWIRWWVEEQAQRQ